MPHLAGDGPRHVNEYYVGGCVTDNDGLIAERNDDGTVAPAMNLVASFRLRDDARDYAAKKALESPGARYYVLEMSFGAIASVTVDTKEY